MWKSIFMHFYKAEEETDIFYVEMLLKRENSLDTHNMNNI